MCFGAPGGGVRYHVRLETEVYRRDNGFLHLSRYAKLDWI